MQRPLYKSLSSANSRAGARKLLSVGRLRRAGMMAVVAVCKLALLLAMFQSAGKSVETNYETAEQNSIETVCTTEGQVSAARSTVTHKLAVRALQHGSGLGRGQIERSRLGSCPSGHRLSNGDCAPRLC